MHTEPAIKKLVEIDKTKVVYTNFVNALLAIDWSGPDVTPGISALQYSPGIRFNNIPWMLDHKGFRKLLDVDSHIPDSIKPALESALPFFDYIEELVPGYKIIKAEMMATQPESVDRLSELSRMHHDARIYHRYSKRCQLAILTNPGAFLFVEDHQLNVSDSCIYEFNNRMCHWGVNWGTSLKLVLIIDLIEMKVWDSLPKNIKDKLFDEEVTLDSLRTKQYIARFKERFKL